MNDRQELQSMQLHIPWYEKILALLLAGLIIFMGFQFLRLQNYKISLQKLDDEAIELKQITKRRL